MNAGRERGVIMNNNNNRKFIDRFAQLMSRHRIIIIVCVLLSFCVFTYGATKIRGEVILQDMLPYDHPYLKLHARFSEVFGSGGSGAAIIVKVRNGDIFNERTLTKLQKITNEVEMWEEVYRILTVSIGSRSIKKVTTLKRGEIKIEPLMWPNIPKTPKEMDALKESIFANTAYNGTLVSKDGTAALIFTEFKENISYERAFGLLREIVNTYTDSETSIHLVGYPVLMGWIYDFKSQIYLIFLVSILIMLATLFCIFRNRVGVFVPVATSFFFTIVGLGIMGFTGFNFSPLLYVLAFLVGAMMVSHSVQSTNRYLEELHATGDRQKACYMTMRSMVVPAFAAVTTDTAAFIVLSLAKIALMQQLALVMGLWMMSVIFTSVLTPIVCSFLPMNEASENWSKGQGGMGYLDKCIVAITRFSIGRGKYVAGVVTVVLLVTCVWLMSGLKIGDATPGSPLLWPNHRYNKDQALINKDFDSSSENYMLFYEGEANSVYDPAVLNTFEAFTRHMEERLPDIYKSSSSVISIVKMVNATLHDGDQTWDQLPRNTEMLYGLMGYVKSNTDIGTLSRFMDRTMERAQITLYFSDHTSDNLLRIKDAAYDFFKNHPMKVGKGEFKLAGGRVGMETALNEEMKRTHLETDGIVYGAVFILCMISFFSIVGGFMLTLPLILANAVAISYMALSNIGLSINTLPVTAIGAGMGVDFAIYFYSRCRDEFPNERNWKKTILIGARTSGKAVVYTGLTMLAALIPWYFLSGLKFQAQMGIFLALVLAMNVILTLTLHPLMLYIVKPKFITRGGVVVEKEVSKEEEMIMELSGNDNG